MNAQKPRKRQHQKIKDCQWMTAKTNEEEKIY